jgi:hypothetical protein
MEWFLVHIEMNGMFSNNCWVSNSRRGYSSAMTEVLKKAAGHICVVFV